MMTDTTKDIDRYQNVSTLKPPKDNILGFKKTQEDTVRLADNRRYELADSNINKILDKTYYINKLKSEQKEVAPVENIKQKTERAARDILKLLYSPENIAQQTLTSENENAQPSQKESVPVREHPFMKDQGGMAAELDIISPEFLEKFNMADTMDMTEVYNQIKKEYEKNIELLNKLKNQNKPRPAPSPSLKPGQAKKLVPKFELAQKLLPPLPKPRFVPERPAPAPPKPRPAGY